MKVICIKEHKLLVLNETYFVGSDLLNMYWIELDNHLRGHWFNTDLFVTIDE